MENELTNKIGRISAESFSGMLASPYVLVVGKTDADLFEQSGRQSYEKLATVPIGRSGTFRMPEDISDLLARETFDVVLGDDLLDIDLRGKYRSPGNCTINLHDNRVEIGISDLLSGRPVMISVDCAVLMPICNLVRALQCEFRMFFRTPSVSYRYAVFVSSDDVCEIASGNATESTLEAMHISTSAWIPSFADGPVRDRESRGASALPLDRDPRRLFSRRAPKVLDENRASGAGFAPEADAPEPPERLTAPRAVPTTRPFPKPAPVPFAPPEPPVTARTAEPPLTARPSAMPPLTAPPAEDPAEEKPAKAKKPKKSKKPKKLKGKLKAPPTQDVSDDMSSDTGSDDGDSLLQEAPPAPQLPRRRPAPIAPGAVEPRIAKPKRPPVTPIVAKRDAEPEPEPAPEEDVVEEAVAEDTPETPTIIAPEAEAAPTETPPDPVIVSPKPPKFRSLRATREPAAPLRFKPRRSGAVAAESEVAAEYEDGLEDEDLLAEEALLDDADAAHEAAEDADAERDADALEDEDDLDEVAEEVLADADDDDEEDVEGGFFETLSANAAPDLDAEDDDAAMESPLGDSDPEAAENRPEEDKPVAGIGLKRPQLRSFGNNPPPATPRRDTSSPMPNLKRAATPEARPLAAFSAPAPAPFETPEPEVAPEPVLPPEPEADATPDPVPTPEPAPEPAPVAERKPKRLASWSLSSISLPKIRRPGLGAAAVPAPEPEPDLAPAASNISAPAPLLLQPSHSLPDDAPEIEEEVDAVEATEEAALEAANVNALAEDEVAEDIAEATAAPLEDSAEADGAEEALTLAATLAEDIPSADDIAAPEETEAAPEPEAAALPEPAPAPEPEPAATPAPVQIPAALLPPKPSLPSSPWATARTPLPETPEETDDAAAEAEVSETAEAASEDLAATPEADQETAKDQDADAEPEQPIMLAFRRPPGARRIAAIDPDPPKEETPTEVALDAASAEQEEASGSLVPNWSFVSPRAARTDVTPAPTEMLREPEPAPAPEPAPEPEPEIVLPPVEEAMLVGTDVTPEPPAPRKRLMLILAQENAPEIEFLGASIAIGLCQEHKAPVLDLTEQRGFKGIGFWSGVPISASLTIDEFTALIAPPEPEPEPEPAPEPEAETEATDETAETPATEVDDDAPSEASEDAETAAEPAEAVVEDAPPLTGIAADLDAARHVVGYLGSDLFYSERLAQVEALLDGFDGDCELVLLAREVSSMIAVAHRIKRLETRTARVYFVGENATWPRYIDPDQRFEHVPVEIDLPSSSVLLPALLQGQQAEAAQGAGVDGNPLRSILTAWSQYTLRMMEISAEAKD